MGSVSVRKRDFEARRTLMFRYAWSRWGAFCLFRVMESELKPLLRNCDSASLLICIWFSAPQGFALAEFIRRRCACSPASPAREPLLDMETKLAEPN
jgi:hypothetical protein